jgi:prephenate dehydrogenase
MMSFLGGSQLFRKVTIIGVGLMGGSIGMAIKKRKLAHEVVGISQQQSTIATAVKSGAIDHGSHDIKKAVNNADLVILSTPVSIIAELLPTIGPHLKRNCIVTDVGSTKASIVSAAHKFFPQHVAFVGSHPLAGSEKKGAEFADADLFMNSTCLMTPTENTNRGACERVKLLWTKVGAKVKFLSPDEHDKILAYISHLPHLVAYSLIGSIPQEHMEYAAQGLKDTTRTASSSPQMWSDICMANKKNILAALDEMVKNLGDVRKMVIANDQQNLVNYFKNSKGKRDALN